MKDPAPAEHVKSANIFGGTSLSKALESGIHSSPWL